MILHAPKVNSQITGLKNYQKWQSTSAHEIGFSTEVLKKYFLNKKKSTENTIQYLFPSRRGNSYGKCLDRKKAKGQTQRTRQFRESVFEIG